MTYRRRAIAAAAAIGLLLLMAAVSTASAASPPFRVRLDENAARASVTGRLFVFLSQRGRGEPRFGPNWFRPEPFSGRT